MLELQKRIALYQDMKAYKQLYALFFPKLFRFSYSIVKSREAAEEIVSDVFIKIWQMKESLSAILNLNVYLYTATKNFSLNHIASHQKRNVISLESFNDDNFLNLVTPEDTLISAETMSRINAAINQLPAQCKSIFYLVRECDLTYKEVAALLEISVNTVRNQLTIAARKIADSLPVSIRT